MLLKQFSPSIGWFMMSIPLSNCRNRCLLLLLSTVAQHYCLGHKSGACFCNCHCFLSVSDGVNCISGGRKHGVENRIVAVPSADLPSESLQKSWKSFKSWGSLRKISKQDELKSFLRLGFECTFLLSSLSCLLSCCLPLWLWWFTFQSCNGLLVNQWA